MKGWGSKSLVCSSKPRANILFGGIYRESCRDIPGNSQGTQKSVTFLAGHGEIRPSHMGDPHGGPQTSPQHADRRGLGAFLRKTMQEIRVDGHVVGRSAGRHLDPPMWGANFAMAC